MEDERAVSDYARMSCGCGPDDIDITGHCSHGGGAGDFHIPGPDAVWKLPDDGLTYPPLVMVEWVDTTNIAAWTNLDEIADWAPIGGFTVRNIGYLIHEDDDCVVLAARVALSAEPQQVGLYERIPKGVIGQRWTLRDGVLLERR